MDARTILNILDKADKHGVLVVRDDGSVYKIVHLEESRYDEGLQLRFWYFDECNQLEDTHHELAPNGELDLLAVYGDDLDCYGFEGEMFRVVSWC